MKGCVKKESLLRWMGQLRASDVKLLRRRRIIWPVAFNLFCKAGAKVLFRK